MAAAAGAAGASGSLLAGCGAKNAIQSVTGSGSSGCAKLTDIEHIVIFIQENRSFDHYFGSYRGVRGFNDASAFFRQPYPANTTSSPTGVLLPFHLDTTKPSAACTQDIAHDWVSQHQSWNNGAMDGFLSSKSGNGQYAVNTMGYYTLPIPTGSIQWQPRLTLMARTADRCWRRCLSLAPLFTAN
jgi:phospholipase C